MRRTDELPFLSTYRNHGTHAEGIEIIFDPSTISYRTLLEFFFQIHDPSTMNRQGNDRGTSYRSGTYYTSEDQRRIAEETIADVNASGLWPGKVVTEVAPAGAFWEAEPEHQDYLEYFPNGYTCHFVRPGWKLPQRAEPPNRLIDGIGGGARTAPLCNSDSVATAIPLSIPCNRRNGQRAPCAAV
jgi:peptide-methionine (S)-S-oxide reductase